MLRIRLRRTGARKKPQYRLVVAESTSPRDGRYIEIIGTYNPLTNPSTVNIDTSRAQHWLSVGATPSDRVHKLLAREGLMAPPAFATPKATDAAADGTAADGTAVDATADGATDDAATGTPAVAEVAATSAAMAPAAEEAGASGPIPDVDEDAGAPATAESTDAATAEATATPDAASEAV